MLIVSVSVFYLEEFPHNAGKYDRFLYEYPPFSASLYFCREVIYSQNVSVSFSESSLFS